MLLSLFEKITHSVTYLLLFCIPLIFLPWTQDVLETNKQIFLVILTILGLVAWLGSMVMQRRFEFRSGWMNLIPGLYLFSVLVSSVFSKAKYQSWVGQSSQEYVSFLTITLFVCVFYLFANIHKNISAQRKSLFALLMSATISGLFSMLQLFGIFILPFAFTKATQFNTVGTFNHLTLFLTVVMFIGLALWLVSHEGHDRIIVKGANGMIMRVLIFLVSIMSVISLVAVNYWVFWILVILGVLLLTAFGFLQTKEFPSSGRFAFPLLLLFVSLFFLFLPSPFSFKLPLLVSPSYGASWGIAKSTLSSGVPLLFFGAGPGTFPMQYQLFKPLSVNGTQLWSVVFDRAQSSFLTHLSDLGLVGTAVWLVLMGWIALLAINRLVNARNHETWKMTYVLFVGWFILLVSQFLSSSNLTLELLLWIMSGMLVAHLLPGVWRTDFAKSPRLGLLTSFLFVFVIVGMFASILLMGERFMGEKAFTKAVKLDAKNTDIQTVIQTLAQANKYNPMSDVYLRNLSFALFTKASQKMNVANGKQLSADQTKEITELVSASIQVGQRAVQISPNQVANWQLLGTTYREVMPFAQNAETLAAQAFTNTMKLEPTNPAHVVDLARVYLAVADRARSLKSSKDPEQAKGASEQEPKLLVSAEEILTKAIKLKGDYLPAHYYLAATFEREGKTDQAIARLVALTKNSPSDIGLGFELSQLYIRIKKFDLAQKELERIITINPKYSNALWYLASVYEIQNNHDKATELVKKVVELNPDNKDAQDRLQKLQAGQVTTTIPDPIQPQPAADGALPEAPTSAPKK